MFPDDPNQTPGDPDETSPDLPLPDYSTRRIEPQDLEPPADPTGPARSDYATRKLEPDHPEPEGAATRRIDPDELFSALEPPVEPPTPPVQPPTPPVEPTRIIDEPTFDAAGAATASVFSLPDTPAPVETPLPPEPPRAGGFSLPPTPEAPRPGSFSLPPEPAAPAGASVPPAKKNNTAIWIAAAAGVGVLVLCCICICGIIAFTMIASTNGGSF